MFEKLSRQLFNIKGLAIGLFILTFALYFSFYTGEQKHLNYFVPLAEAFLNSRLDVLEHPSWLNELVNFEGKYYVVYPPMPAILLMPLVFIFGTDFPQPLFSIFVGALNVALCFLVINRIFKSVKVGVFGSLLYGFGTMMWYHAVVGSAWYIAHIIAMCFIWLSILELFSKNKSYLLVGILIGAAYWSRLPAILAIVFPLLYFREEFVQFKPRLKINFKNCFTLGVGVGFFVGLNFLYNFLRFGVPYDISYQLLPVFEEPWYKNGLFSIVNIPIHLNEIFTALPKFSLEWPYFIPSLHVMALWFVTPALLLIFFAPFKKRIVWVSVITVLVMSLPGLSHGSNGFTQFGFRFALDYHPFLVILIVAGLQKKYYIVALILLVLSILVNLWGMILITFYKLWTM